tara:strand:- start:3834 stop:4172 length:339 start_codon:yes stop_codon:yes gene_type:complete
MSKGFLVDYNGGIDAEDYKLKFEGNGNGFSLRSECCEILNYASAREAKGVIELTLEHVTRGGISLGDADRVVMTAEDARDLIETLQEAVEDAEAYEEELIAKHEEKELTTTS